MQPQDWPLLNLPIWSSQKVSPRSQRMKSRTIRIIIVGPTHPSLWWCEGWQFRRSWWVELIGRIYSSTHSTHWTHQTHSTVSTLNTVNTLNTLNTKHTQRFQLYRIPHMNFHRAHRFWNSPTEHSIFDWLLQCYTMVRLFTTHTWFWSSPTQHCIFDWLLHTAPYQSDLYHTFPPTKEQTYFRFKPQHNLPSAHNSQIYSTHRKLRWFCHPVFPSSVQTFQAIWKLLRGRLEHRAN